MAEYKGNCMLSKKKYFMLEEALKKEITDMGHVNLMLTILKNILQFDPNVNTYLAIKEKLGEDESTYRKHNKTYYEKHKEELNKHRNAKKTKST
jgi:hypothetical protein